MLCSGSGEKLDLPFAFKLSWIVQVSFFSVRRVLKSPCPSEAPVLPRMDGAEDDDDNVVFPCKQGTAMCECLVLWMRKSLSWKRKSLFMDENFVLWKRMFVFMEENVSFLWKRMSVFMEEIQENVSFYGKEMLIYRWKWQLGRQALSTSRSQRGAKERRNLSRNVLRGVHRSESAGNTGISGVP